MEKLKEFYELYKATMKNLYIVSARIDGEDISEQKIDDIINDNMESDIEHFFKFIKDVVIPFNKAPENDEGLSLIYQKYTDLKPHLHAIKTAIDIGSITSFNDASIDKFYSGACMKALKEQFDNLDVDKPSSLDHQNGVMR